MPTDLQSEMARRLHLNPNTPDDWPLDIIDWLIELD
jgi:hypothetical protein